MTGYTFYTGYPKNCGCFGDCLLISSKTSFLKDVVLLLLIAFLLWKQHLIKPIFSEKSSTWFMLAVTIFSFGLQWYALTYLPVVDCLPYKKGNNIPEKMKMPANAIPDSTVITFTYEKAGKKVEFTADNFPADFDTNLYRNPNRYDKLIRAGKNNEPPIKGFSLSGPTEVDSTQIVLDHPYAILVFIENFDVPVSKWKKDFETIYAAAKSKNVPAYVVASNRIEAIRQFAGTGFGDIQVFKCDFTAIRTAARTSPCVYLLQKGTIKGKWSHKTMTRLMDDLNAIPTQQP